MAIKFRLISDQEPGVPNMKCPAWRVAAGALSMDAGINPVVLLRAEDGSLGGLICVADSGYQFTSLAREQLDQALKKFETRGWAPESLECAITGGADSAKWKIAKLRNITAALGLAAKEFDINGLFYRKFYFDPLVGLVTVQRDKANPDHWNPALARLTLEDSVRAFSDIHAGGVVANATRFFRDKNVFAALEELIIPEHLKLTPREPLNVWSSACSNGAETYSLAMFIHRRLEELKSRTPFMVFGSDINPHLVAAAKGGIYQMIKNDLDKHRDYFERYGALRGVNVTFGEEIRRHVSFRVFDLKNRPLRYKFRLIVCANVFQYYNEDARRFFLQNFLAASQRPGYIYIGHVSDNTIEGLNLKRAPKHKMLEAI